MYKHFDPIADKCGEIVEYIMSSPDLPDDDGVLFKIRLSVEEVVENVVRYAYENGAGYLEARVEKSADNMLNIQLKDEGKPFDPLAKPDPDITLSAEEREIGGLGIFLCKQMMDNVTYRFENNCNILTLQKQL